MTPTSSLPANRNCLQVQADRSISSAIAGTHDNSPPATLKTARNLMAVLFTAKSVPQFVSSPDDRTHCRRLKARFGPCKAAARQATFGGSTQTGRTSYGDHIGHRRRSQVAFGAGGGAVLRDPGAVRLYADPGRVGPDPGAPRLRQIV